MADIRQDTVHENILHLCLLHLSTQRAEVELELTFIQNKNIINFDSNKVLKLGFHLRRQAVSFHRESQEESSKWNC